MNHQSKTMRMLLLMSVVLLLCGTRAVCRAQFGGDRIQRPLNNPTVSPYLNLLRNNNRNGPVLNYYGLVRPQLQAYGQAEQFGQNLQQLQFQQQRQPGGMRMPVYSRLGITGHPVVFQSFTSEVQSGFGGAGIGGFGGGGFAPGAVGGGLPGRSFGSGAGGFGGVTPGLSGGEFSGAGGASGGGIGMTPGMGITPGAFGGMTGHGAMFGTYRGGGRGGF